MSATVPSFTLVHRRVTGGCALIGGILAVAMVGLYFVYAGPPPLSNVLGRTLLTVIILAAFLIFAVGLHRMIMNARGGDPGLSGSVAVAALISYLAVTLVSASLEAGTSLWYPDGSLDPTVDGPLSAAAVLLHGPVARILIATYLVALALASRNILSAGVRTGSVVLALINLALVPSLFFGMNAAFVYASNGWGSVASIGAINMIWFAVVGAAVLRDHPARVAKAHQYSALARLP